jgi:hypothetical protein
MNLTEFSNRNTRLKKILAILRENYNYSVDFNKFTKTKATTLIGKAQSKLVECEDMHLRIKYRLIAEAATLWNDSMVTPLYARIAEGIDDTTVEEVKVILAAKEISDKIQGMIEDAAKMQVQDLLPIIDAMKSEIGSAEASAFSNTADGALQALVDSLKSSKEEFDNAIAVAQGVQVESDMGSYGDEMTGDAEMDTDMQDPEFGGEDDDESFGGDDANIGGASTVGREMKDDF